MNRRGKVAGAIGRCRNRVSIKGLSLSFDCDTFHTGTERQHRKVRR